MLVVNPFYRIKRAPTLRPHPDFNAPATRRELMHLIHSFTPERTVTDTHAFVPWLDDRAAVSKTRKMASIGYCMGGPFNLRTAAAFPDSIGAGATFH